MRFVTYLAENMFDGTEDERFSKSLCTELDKVRMEWLMKVDATLSKIKGITDLKLDIGGSHIDQYNKLGDMSNATIDFKFHGHHGQLRPSVRGYEVYVTVKDADYKELFNFTCKTLKSIEERFQHELKTLWKNPETREKLLNPA